MRRVTVALLLFLASGTTAADAKSPVRTRVALEIEDRTGFDYRWEFNLVVRVSSRVTGAPVRKAQIDVVGAMNVPGHSMQTVPARFASDGNGAYTGKLAFYMPGRWTIRVTVTGRNLVRSMTQFPVFLDPTTPAP